VLLSVTPGRPSASAELVLRKRALKIFVADQDRKPVTTATLRSSVLRINEPGIDGLYDATTFPAGQDMHIRAPGFLAACVHVSQSADQMVRLHRMGTHSASIILISPPNSPPSRAPRFVIGTLEGLPGSECPVAVRDLRIRDLTPENAGEVAARIAGLPAGEFSFRVEAQARPQLVRAPGTPIRYVIPDVCRFCG
jgi:hypothetical protein